MNMCTVCTYNADPENTLFLRTEILKTALLRRKTLENGGMIGKSAVGKAWSLRKPEVFRSVIFICYRGCRPNIPSIQLQAVSKARAVCRYISVGEMQGFSIATGNFGAKGITLISRGRILKRYIRNQLKKDAGQSLLTPDFAPFTTSRAAIVLSGCHALKVLAGTVRVTPAYEEPRALCEALFIAPAAFFSSLLLRKIFTHLEQSVGSSDNRPLLWAVPSMVLQRKTKTYFSSCRNATPQTPFLGGYGFFLCTCNGINLSGGQ